MSESSTPDVYQQLIRELRRRVRDLEAQNALLRQFLATIRAELSADFTLMDCEPC